MALVTSVRNGNSYAGVYLFVRVSIDHHPGKGSRHMEWGALAVKTSRESDPDARPD